MADVLGGGFRVGVLSLVLLGLTGCGGGDGDDDDPSGEEAGAGQVTESWRPYCVASFTRDYAVTDAFGDRLLTARRGEQYLMAAYGEFFGNDHAELLYLTSKGPASFEIDVTSGSRAFPFSTPCAFDDTLPYYAVFDDVSVYAEAELVTKLCDLPRSSVLPRNVATGAGYSTTDFDFNGPATYQVQLNAFSVQCGGATQGYISVPMTQVFSTNTWLVPIVSIIGPK